MKLERFCWCDISSRYQVIYEMMRYHTSPNVTISNKNKGINGSPKIYVYFQCHLFVELLFLTNGFHINLNIFKFSNNNNYNSLFVKLSEGAKNSYNG